MEESKRLLDVKNIEYLEGKTVTKIEGLKKGSEDIRFIGDGFELSLFHEEDCCESVTLEEFDGDETNIVGQKIHRAHCVSHEMYEEYEYEDKKHRWTFYIISTQKGTLHLRWYGRSNGYYSLAVNTKIWEVI